jgi:hypothetical protein
MVAKQVFGGASLISAGSRHCNQTHVRTLMQNPKQTRSLFVLFLTLAIFVSPLNAQQRRNTAPKKTPAAEVVEIPPSFDSLLAAESFKIYCEIRSVGGLIRSSAVTDILEPIIKLGGPPKEFKTAVKWLTAHSEVLAGSRMIVAGWPSRPNLPNILVAIEFASTEDAKKFYPELRGFMPTLVPTPTPTPAATPPAADQQPVIASKDPTQTGDKPTSPDALPYHMQQTGALILISDAPISTRNLRPKRSKGIEEDQNFASARNRFVSESVFLYVDFKSIEKEEKDRRRGWEAEAEKRAEAEAANPPPIQEIATEPIPAVDETPSPPPEPVVIAETAVGSRTPVSGETATLSSGSTSDPDIAGPMLFPLYSALFGGEGKWPEAIAAALVFEGDAYVLRTLMINSSENKNSAVPFLPQFVSGPEIAPQSPNIFPADVELFATVSLDYQGIYDGTLKALAAVEQRAQKYGRVPVKELTPPPSPFAVYEEKLGLKIKDDILPLFGNEFALVMPKNRPKPVTDEAAKTREVGQPSAQLSATAPPPTANPVIAIAVKDKEAVTRLIPKLIDTMGLKGANLLAQTEKHEGAEIVSYAGFFAYAFIGDFLVLSPDPLEVRHVVDSYLEHQTLGSDSHFRNYTRWQSRQVLGQVYVAPSLVEQYLIGNNARNERSKDFLSRVAPVIDPLTFSLSNDGSGPLHELHVPKNLLQSLVANMAADAEQAPLRSNEAMAKNMLYSIIGSEATFKSGKGAGSYGTLEQLIAEHMLDKTLIENYGYRFEVITMGDKFEANAVPLNYGKTGKLSFFIDETGVVRGADHAGAPATVSDDPIR